MKVSEILILSKPAVVGAGESAGAEGRVRVENTSRDERDVRLPSRAAALVGRREAVVEQDCVSNVYSGGRADTLAEVRGRGSGRVRCSATAVGRLS